MNSIVVPVTGDAADRPVFETALRLAHAVPTHLVFLHVHEDVVQVITTMIAGQADGAIALEEMRVDLETEAARLEISAKQAVEAFCAEHHITLSGAGGHGPSAVWTSVTGMPNEVLVSFARTADLIVMGRDGLGDVVSHVVVEGGRPVLFAPVTVPAPGTLLQHVAIAWNDTPEAARAVAAVTPLLEKAGSVAIMTVADEALSLMTDSASRLAATLRHHGPRAEIVSLRADGHPAGEVLLQAAQAAGASLLVMGGYNHSRLRELVFGGFTRDMLETATLPILIAH